MEVHKYKKPHDWSLARLALEETKHTYEKRVRELLEGAFELADLSAEVPLRTYADICKEAARRISSHLILSVP